MTQNVMPEKVWVTRLKRSGVVATFIMRPPMFDEEDGAVFVPESSLTSLRSENEKMRELLKECVAKKEMDGAYPGGCSCGLCQEWRDLITRISHFTQDPK